jgi:hypothetical protein
MAAAAAAAKFCTLFFQREHRHSMLVRFYHLNKQARAIKTSARRFVTTRHISRNSRANNNPNALFRPLLFTGFVCATSFGAEAIYTYEQKIQEKSSEKSASSAFWNWSSLKLFHNKSQKLALSTPATTTRNEWRLPATLRDALPRRVTEFLETTANYISLDPRKEMLRPLIAASLLVHIFVTIPARFSSRVWMFQQQWFVHKTIMLLHWG